MTDKTADVENEATDGEDETVLDRIARIREEIERCSWC